jgi:hypothetical protein
MAERARRWPNEPDELVDRLITDHLEGLLARP